MIDTLGSAHHQRVVKAFTNYEFPQVVSPNPIFNLLRDKFYQQQVIQAQSGCFMPIAFPTGVGKTFNTVSLMLDTILNDIENELLNGDNYIPKYCYYITNSVDNVFDVYINLVKRIKENGQLNEEQKEVIIERILYLPANSKSLLDVFEKPTVLKKIKELFHVDKNTHLSNELDQVAREQTVLTSLNLQPIEKKAFLERHNNSASECYSTFIQHIQKIQLSKNPVKLSDKSITLLKELIPGVAFEMGITRVMFMTTKKFLFGLQQSKGKFHPARNLTGNILIIDEIDRQHQEILTHLVSANDTDLLATIRTIHSNLKEHNLCAKPQYAGIADLFLDYLNEVKLFFDEWSLRNSFDIHGSVINDEKKVLLFSDKLTTHTTSVSGQLKVSFNEVHQQHEIALKGQFGDRTENDFPKFLGRLERLVNREFQSIVRQAEELYRTNLTQVLSQDELRHITSTQAIASILDQLNLHSLRNQLNQQLSYLVGRKYSPRKSAANYHTRGIRMIEVDHLPESQDSVMFKHHGFNVTPTGMLASWVESGCSILGISATAECASVIHNFDIRYLKESLGTQYIELTTQQRNEIHSYYEQERNYIDADVKILVNSVNHDYAFIRHLLKQWKPEAKNVDLLLKQLLACGDDDIEFGMSWLSKLCKAIDFFAQSTKSRYMIGMLNRSIRVTIHEFLTWYVYQLAEREKQTIKVIPGIDANFLKQGKFDSEVINFLENQPGKMIALTTYQTMSSGKNPDYKFNSHFENNTLRHVGHRSNERTDIDFIYLEEPTHLISVEGYPETKTSDRLLLLSYGMALQEAGVITQSQAYSWTNNVVRHDSPSNLCRELKNKFYKKDSDDCLHAIYRMIEQAVGRTARTEMKREIICIIADSSLMTLLANDERDAALFSHEYRELINHAKIESSHSNSSLNREERRQQNLAVLQTSRSLGAIERMLTLINSAPSEKYVSSWKELRIVALKSPATVLPPLYREYYVLSPTNGEYAYSPPSDEWKIDEYRFFDLSTEPNKRICESASMLPILMKNQSVKDYFEEKGFCTHWPEDAKYILTPPMFINIYLGALGEEAGKFILSKHGFQFESLPLEYFEQFDEIVVLQNKKALIDFKHWDLAAWRSIPEEVRKKRMSQISNKLHDLGIHKLVICNLFTTGDEPVLFFDVDFNQIDNESRASIMSIPNLMHPGDSSINSNVILKLARWILM